MEEESQEQEETSETIERSSEPERKVQVEQKPEVVGIPVRKKKPLKNFFWIIIFLLILGALGWYFLGKEQDLNLGQKEGETKTLEESFPSEAPEPTREPVDKEQIKLQILNGSGIKGEASFLKGEIEELGYVNIETGNAEQQNMQNSHIIFSTRLDDTIKDEIKEKLRTLYKEVDAEEQSEIGGFDILITVGLRKGQEFPTPTPTKKPTPTPSPTPKQTVTPTPTQTVTPTPTPAP